MEMLSRGGFQGYWEAFKQLVCPQKEAEVITTLQLNNGSFVVSRPKPSDIKLLSKLYRECRAAVDQKLVPDYFAKFPPEAFSGIWESLFKHPEIYRAGILWKDEKAIGFYRVGPSKDYQEALVEAKIPKKDSIGELHQIYLLPGYEGIGLGKSLYQLAKVDFRELGYKEFIICTYTKNDAAVGFYIAMGAEKILDAKLNTSYYGEDLNVNISFFCDRA